ncbi:MAG: hypothetical protein AAB227_06555, partial [Pseudomonadota bacterium]
MKSNAPWSVKGIERDARETAKAAAQREGMTVGEWLNQIIFSAGDPDAPATTGEIDGLKARDLAAAIEHLSKRIAIAESKSASAVDNLARSLGGAVERMQRIERAEPAGVSDGALAARVKLLEEKSTDRQRIEALRALERAVGQIAVQFSNSEKSTVSRLDATERQLQSIAGRLEDGAGGDAVSASAVRDAIEGMAERVSRAEKIAAEAARLKDEAAESVDADFIHKTGLRLRILGDEIKRGGDQIRTLETTISRLSQQIDGAEKRSAEGVQKVAETINDLKTQFSSADATDQADARADIEAAVSEITQRTEDRIESLQRSFDDMVRRLEAASGRASDPAPQAHVKPAMLAATPAPAAVSAPADDFDSELDDAFAALDLEDPIPTPHDVRAPAERQVSAPAADTSDDFGFDAEQSDEEAARESQDVLAEIREAFGIDAPAQTQEAEDEEAQETQEAAEIDASDDEVEFAPELPPMATAPEEKSGNSADYLKAARQAAREAAAQAATDDESASPKKKLTPKQRAILAARIKRRKQEAETAKADVALAAPVAAPFAGDDADDGEAKASIKTRIAGLVAKIKSRPAPSDVAPEKADGDPGAD